MAKKHTTIEKETKTGLIYTKTVESGAFIRTQYRKGDKTKTKTERMTKNKKKVVLGRLGDFEYYAYPYDYPDTIFIGQFPLSTKVTSGNVNQIMRFYNIAKWYLEGNAFSKPKRRKEANSRRRSIARALNHGLDEQRSKKQASSKQI